MPFFESLLVWLLVRLIFSYRAIEIKRLDESESSGSADKLDLNLNMFHSLIAASKLILFSPGSCSEEFLIACKSPE